MEHWINDIDEVTRQVQQEFGALPNEALNWQPGKKEWSIAQVLDHIMLINESYFEVMTDLRTGKLKLPFFHRFGVISRFFGALLGKAVEPDRKHKLKTFRIWKPEKAAYSPEIIEAFIKHQEKLKLYILKLEEHVEKGSMAHSPVNRNIVLRADTMIDILVSHEKRHLNQAREVLFSINRRNDKTDL